MKSEQFRHLGSRYFNEEGELIVQIKKNPPASLAKKASNLFVGFADEENIIVKEE